MKPIIISSLLCCMVLFGWSHDAATSHLLTDYKSALKEENSQFKVNVNSKFLEVERTVLSNQSTSFRIYSADDKLLKSGSFTDELYLSISDLGAGSFRLELIGISTKSKETHTLELN